MGFLAARAMYRRIAWRFPIPLWLRGYVVGKLALDPAFREVLEQVRGSNTPILDVGCGMGLLAHYLREHGVSAPIHGVDLDGKKIGIARIAAAKAGLQDVTFATGDAAGPMPPHTTVVVLDVVHYLERSGQAQMLANLAEQAVTVILRTAPRDDSWRFKLVLLQERWTRATGWIPVAGGSNFATVDEIVRPFSSTGWNVDVRPLWGRTPFNSHVFVCRRKAAATADPRQKASAGQA